MKFSSPRDQVGRDVDIDNPRIETSPAELVTMPSSNFSSRLRRMHSGRITENSEVWPQSATDREDSKPVQSVIANSATHIPSRGKRTGMESPQQQATAKERLRLDERQPEGKRSQRKHDFPTSPRIQKEMSDFQRISPRATTTVEGARPSHSRTQLQGLQEAASTQGEWGKCLVDVQHRTSAGMISTLMPERACEGIPVADRKYMIGNELVDWGHGRRVATVRVAQPAPTFSSTGTIGQIAGMPSQGHRVHCFGAAAHQYTMVPPSHVGYSVRASGAFAPHAPRVAMQPSCKQSL